MKNKCQESEDNSWTIDEMKKMYELRQKGLHWNQIEKSFQGRGWKALSRKYSRTNWSAFFNDPNASLNYSPKKWTHEEMIQLEAFIQAGQSYEFIAGRMGRSISSVESQAQHTDWKAWNSIRNLPLKDGVAESQELQEDQNFCSQLVGALLQVCRNDFERLKIVKEEEFLNRTNLTKDRLFLKFEDLREKAKEELTARGFANEESLELSGGTYVIVGDSHGKHTQKEMFALLNHVNSTIKPDKIIHIGHILDDDNDISYDWGNFSNLVILAKVEELKIIQDQRNKFKFKYEVIREEINIGDIVITNQDLITDYVKTPISSLDSQIFDDEKVVVNCHRLEFTTRCCNDSVAYFVSPGCLCEVHKPRTVKQINYEGGRVVKQAYSDGFIKYRRMGHTNKYWEQGLLVVQMDDHNNSTVVPCAIKHTKKGATLSYFDKIITSKGVFKPEKKIFVNGDMHCDLHDVNVLDIQEQICKDYKPDIAVNVGDTFNYASLNHHVMDRGGVILDKKLLAEAAKTHYVLARTRKWAKAAHLIYGNHERFANDFVEKYPQFGEYLDFRFICGLEDLGYKLTSLKNVLKIGSAKFVHGEMKMFGQSGSKMEKASRTFGRDIFIGHIHRPEIRFGCYSIGLSGMLDQNYNEPEASNWLHGFGFCNQFAGESFLTTVAIIHNRCILNGKIYEPRNISSWQKDNYKARIVYDY
jgi:hypothetical protein